MWLDLTAQEVVSRYSLLKKDGQPGAIIQPFVPGVIEYRVYCRSEPIEGDRVVQMMLRTSLHKSDGDMHTLSGVINAQRISMTSANLHLSEQDRVAARIGEFMCGAVLCDRYLRQLLKQHGSPYVRIDCFLLADSDSPSGYKLVLSEFECDMETWCFSDMHDEPFIKDWAYAEAHHLCSLVQSNAAVELSGLADLANAATQ